MAGSEDEAEDVVVDVLERGVEVALGQLGHPQLLHVSHLLQLAREVDVAPDAVDGPPPGGRREPCTRLGRYAVAGPLLERLHEGVLREVLGEADVTDDAGHDRRDLGGLHAPDGLEGALDVVGRCRVRLSGPALVGLVGGG